MAELVQVEFDFARSMRNRARPSASAKGRPHHHTTILTTTQREFGHVSRMGEDDEVEIEFVNDIISSAKGGTDNEHHSIRRASLLRRQLKGGYGMVKVRCAQGDEVVRYIASEITGEEDSCSARVWLSAKPTDNFFWHRA